MPTLNFTVDSALLKELGERLVGKPHIALAELIKNGYDADATEIIIDLDESHDRITITDNGHGMTFNQFRDFWMRIGTPHKDQIRVSSHFQRQMTGSKGVGRLSAQFLASRLHLITVPGDPTHISTGRRSTESVEWLEASLNWDEAVKSGELTSAQVRYDLKTAAPPFPHGTKISLTGLKQSWDPELVRDLAREIWWLQPPFRGRVHSTGATSGEFAIEFRSSESGFKQVFDRQLRAILGFWTARLVGKNSGGQVTLSLEFEGEPPSTHRYSIGDFAHNEGPYNRDVNLRDGDFEIRVFKLKGRQTGGIKVEEARDYFWKHGGVHIYDGGFRLPFYGDPKNDWLGIEFDHSHRRFLSELLPQDVQQQYADTGRLNFLPTLGRIFGVVNVSTSAEPGLDILITRDRLNESSVAFKDLVAMVRYALDLYAYQEGRRKYEADQKKSKTAAPSDTVSSLEDSLDRYKGELPEEAYNALRQGIAVTRDSLRDEQESFRSQMGLMGALATAGISTVAYQHELRKQFSSIEGIASELQTIDISRPESKGRLIRIAEDLKAWVDRARSTVAMFELVADVENIQARRRYRAAQVIDEIKRQTAFLSRGIAVEIERVPDDWLLPVASLAEWGAVFQNVFTNAFNAMLDSDERVLDVSVRADGQLREILVQDTGEGVRLATSGELFQPFKREIRVSPERRALGYGGTGLGLTIVRLIAQRIGCEVGFVEPQRGFSTAFSLKWRESE